MSETPAQQALWDAVAEVEEELPRVVLAEIEEAAFVAAAMELYLKSRDGVHLADMDETRARVVAAGDAIRSQPHILPSTGYLWCLYEALTV